MSQEEYEAIGRRLRDSRLYHRISLRDIAVHLHIRPQYLEALELGKPEFLPGLTYAKGYLQRYAGFLGLDEQELVKAFEKAGVFPQKRLFHFPAYMDRSQDPSNFLTFSTLSGALCLIVFWLSFAPTTPTLKPVIPLPVNAEMLKHIPENCLEKNTFPYPPCYWQPVPLWVNPFTTLKP